MIRDERGRVIAGSSTCATCGRPSVKPDGVILERVANGRTICTGCGRFQVHCECKR